MKELLTTLLTIIAFTVSADIPRVDVMEVTYQGKTYYKMEFVAHLKFEEGCVFDRHTGEYLYEQEDYFQDRNNGDVIVLSTDIVSIPKSKVFEGYNHRNEYDSPNLFQLVGEQIKLSGNQLDSIHISQIHMGSTAGYIFSNGLSKKDEDWIHDYTLEKIARFGDGELCSMELFSIKGNISKKEAKGIENEIRSLYNEILGTRGYTGKTPDEYFQELLKRNILMVGFCSC